MNYITILNLNTFMSADGFHHQVELSLKSQKKAYDFEDFAVAVGENNQEKVDIIILKISDFYDWKDWKSKVNMKRYTDKVYMKDIDNIKAIKGF